MEKRKGGREKRILRLWRRRRRRRRRRKRKRRRRRRDNLKSNLVSLLNDPIA